MITESTTINGTRGPMSAYVTRLDDKRAARRHRARGHLWLRRRAVPDHRSRRNGGLRRVRDRLPARGRRHDTASTPTRSRKTSRTRATGSTSVRTSRTARSRRGDSASAARSRSSARCCRGSRLRSRSTARASRSGCPTAATRRSSTPTHPRAAAAGVRRRRHADRRGGDRAHPHAAERRRQDGGRADLSDGRALVLPSGSRNDRDARDRRRVGTRHRIPAQEPRLAPRDARPARAHVGDVLARLGVRWNAVYAFDRRRDRRCTRRARARRGPHRAAPVAGDVCGEQARGAGIAERGDHGSTPYSSAVATVNCAMPTAPAAGHGARVERRLLQQRRREEGRRQRGGVRRVDHVRGPRGARRPHRSAGSRAWPRGRPSSQAAPSARRPCTAAGPA